MGSIRNLQRIVEVDHIERLEGSSYSQLIQMFRIFGFNKEVDIELATIKSTDPYKIQVDNMKIMLEEEDMIIAESLLEHKRTLRIESQDMTLDSKVTNHDIVSTSPHGPCQTTFTQIGLDAKVTGESVEVTIESPLEVGDRVIIASISNNQKYIVLDKV
ncbi:DUF2577 domain-containing protein [Chengkuizengella axinellae]|uniref:DUF2577 domain-containing protein n=1 Tax=Chengkuizengella axinellae TaxID=3064388 RepID=A0ABT9J257_9BACL|nr:DUF2577 domain-containing protein [Chengkuizengella sp. 2205SS18-9]MDP5275696.1 DUF2577 domain-containing protein [Chengkuizengella sp. 2205SS18-9]